MPSKDLAMLSKCLIPLAGYGTRLAPATKSIPKEMFPVLNKPILQYVFEEAIVANFNDFYCIFGDEFSQNVFKHYLDTSNQIETHHPSVLNWHLSLQEKNFTFLKQMTLRGLGAAVLSARSALQENPFALFLSDMLYDPFEASCMQRMQNIYAQEGCSVIGLQKVSKEDRHSYGIVEGIDLGNGLYQLINMIEKPSPSEIPSSNLAVIGRYILMPSIFDYLEEEKNQSPSGEMNLTKALVKQMQNGKVIGYEMRQKGFDCGQVPGYVEAINYFYQKSKVK